MRNRGEASTNSSKEVERVWIGWIECAPGRGSGTGWFPDRRKGWWYTEKIGREVVVLGIILPLIIEF